MFSAFDEQNNRYFATGMNSETREDCEQEILEFLTEANDLENTDKEQFFKNRTQSLGFFNVRIDEHEDRLEEDW